MAASVLAIATVAAQVGAAFAELRKDCSELPGRLHALSCLQEFCASAAIVPK